MATSPDFPRLRFRLALGRSIVVGPGKADLLAAIAATGSITAAGQSMGMSYKRAWYLLDTMNQCFKEPLVVATIAQPDVWKFVFMSLRRSWRSILAGCEFQAPQKCLRLINVYAISFIP